AGVVDEQVAPPEPLLHRGGERRHGRVVGDVEPQRRAAGLGRDLLEPVHPARAQHDVKARGREGAGARRADPAARSGDDGDALVVRHAWFSSGSGARPAGGLGGGADASSPRRTGSPPRQALWARFRREYGPNTHRNRAHHDRVGSWTPAVRSWKHPVMTTTGVPPDQHARSGHPVTDWTAQAVLPADLGPADL